MLRGPNIIRKCSECSGLIKQITILSGNTFDARFWTDGQTDACLPSTPCVFMKCPHCLSPGWIEEQERVGEVEVKVGDYPDPGFSDPFAAMRNEINPEEKIARMSLYPEAREVCAAEFDDFILELDRQNLDKSRMLYLRIRAWWAGNDKRRYDNHIKPLMTDDELKNLQLLDQIFNITNENDRIMKAEIKRELGQFDEAEDILKEPFEEEDLLHSASFIKDLIQHRNQLVEEITYEQSLEDD